MVKNGYRETTHALGILGDEERKMHGYNVQNASVKTAMVRKGFASSENSDGQMGCEA